MKPSETIQKHAEHLNATVLHVEMLKNNKQAVVAAKWPAKATPFVVWNWFEDGGFCGGSYHATGEEAHEEFSKRIKNVLITAIFKEDPIDRALIAANRFLKLYQCSEHEGESWGDGVSADKRATELRLALDAASDEDFK